MPGDLGRHELVKSAVRLDCRACKRDLMGTHVRYISGMASASAASVGVAGARAGATPASGLLDRTGRPFHTAVGPAELVSPTGDPIDSGPTPIEIARRMQAMTFRDGTALFPDAPDPDLLARATTFPDTKPAWAVALPGRALGTALASVDIHALPDVQVVDLLRRTPA